MNADSVQVFKDAGLKEGLENLPGETGAGWSENRCGRICFANRFARRNCQFDVLMNIGFRIPELDVGFIPNFPDHMTSFEVRGRGGGPLRVSSDALGMLG